ncbi:PhnA domain-containing protein [Microbulbifer sp. OS29]|uniref:PhnA domain-containing protein n=1 Tax=Microbulbifer okhotskensis TaxID=2926617 RepID=A0A9X2EQ61_9GAMM|nr:alkylphosphonate utilization protein [Microbulbifer okhotskensis]MCO1333561.1 PhnA domain-containing protein [Microbulbifer okhotskensis]
MTVSQAQLLQRSEHRCELCKANNELAAYPVPQSNGYPNAEVLLCLTCRDQLENPAQIDGAHWHCLSDSMWNPEPAVQVLAWRILKRLSSETWAQDLFDMLYLDADLLAWAEAGSIPQTDDLPIHRDSNGVQLLSGDSVVIIKDLDVKGSSLVAKRGTTVRGISLTDNPEQVEGRVEGQRIVILTKFVKKSG